jgi:hypothetical protein
MHMYSIASKRNCLYCGDPLKGRADKKFCNDSCRSAYNSQKYSYCNSSGTRRINRILQANRRILRSIAVNKTTITYSSMDVLLQKGFNFVYYTHCFKDNFRAIYYYYEYALMVPDFKDNSSLLVFQCNPNLGIYRKFIS